MTVWAVACGLSFRYAGMQAGNNGNPGPECTFHSSDDELDAVAGLNEDGERCTGGACIDPCEGVLCPRSPAPRVAVMKHQRESDPDRRDPFLAGSNLVRFVARLLAVSGLEAT